jgi:hypothetical protein
LAKHTLEIEFDFDFVLIGISSHEKDYRFCWRINNELKLNLLKKDPLEIKNKKQKTPSFFSFFWCEEPKLFAEYAVIANASETKRSEKMSNTLFNDLSGADNDSDFLIPEQKQFNYFFVIKGEVETDELDNIIKQIKSIENVQTAVRIDVKTLRSKENLIF